MFDIAEPQSIRTNSLLAQEFVKHMSAYELLSACKEVKKKGEDLLSLTPIITGIMNCNDDGKKLLLASDSKLDVFASSENFKRLYKCGEIFKAALFNNSNIEWYGLFIWDDTNLLDSILEDVLKENSLLKTPFYKNSRMDRKLVASIIRAKDYDKNKHKYDFQKINFAERYIAATNALNVDEIKSEHYYGQDSPDSNEMYFDEPLKAVVVLVKDLLNNWEDVDNRSYATNLISYIDKAGADIDYDDWITVDQAKELEIKEQDFTKLYDLSYKIALTQFFNFIDEKTNDIKETVSYKDSTEVMRYFSPASLAITISNKLFNNYRFKDCIKEYISNLLISKNWVMRSVAYTYIFENINLNDSNFESFRKLIDRFGKDRNALIFAIFNTRYLTIASRAKHWFSPIVTDFFLSANFNESMEEYYSKTLTYIYEWDLRECDDDEIAKLFNAKMSKSNNKLAISFLTEELPQSPSLPFQFAKVLGKFFS